MAAESLWWMLMGLAAAITLSAGNSVLEGFAARNGSIYYPNAGVKVNSNNNNIVTIQPNLHIP